MVLLETEWFCAAHMDSVKALCAMHSCKLLGLKNVHAEDESTVAAGRPAPPFFPFDQSFVRSAKRAGVSDVAAVAPN
jgi:hypothetical protein